LPFTGDFTAKMKTAWEKLITFLERLNSNTETFSSDFRNQLTLAEDIFCQFCYLGIALRNRNLKVSQTSETVYNAVIDLVKRHEDWLQDFILHFTYNEVDLDGSTPEDLICEVRTGIQFMIEDFGGISEEFDNLLEEFKEDTEDLDEKLKIWQECAFQLHIDPKIIDKNIPRTHWWWFLDQ
jgi:hypothetical protein